MNSSIILAAGEGTRMKSKHSKVLTKLLNRPLLGYVLDALEGAGVDKKVVIVGRNESQVKALYGERCLYVKQEIGEDIPYGTGYAASLGVELLDDQDSVLLVCGDTPLVRKESLQELLELHETEGNAATVMSGTKDDPFNYGRIVRDASDNFIGIVEEKDCTADQKKIKEFNSGMYAFKADMLKKALSQIDTNNQQGELLLTDVFVVLRKMKQPIGVYRVKDSVETDGINDKKQLAEAEVKMRKRINEAHMMEGVIMEVPETISIEPGVTIGRDTRIGMGVTITGNTTIGEDCWITAGSRLDNAKIGNDVRIDSSVVESSVMEDGSNIGPYSHLRPNAHLGKGVHIGNFVEVKNATMGEGSKAGHLAYVGDADLGKNINVGCGVVFVNYDGKFKHRSTIADNAFIGSNANIVAPVFVDEEGYVAAGSTITKDVGKGELSIERAEQRNIEGYVARKKARDANKLEEIEAAKKIAEGNRQ